MNSKVFELISIDRLYYKKTERLLFGFYVLFCAVFITFGFLNQALEVIFVILCSTGFYFSFIKYVQAEWITEYTFYPEVLKVKSIKGESLQYSLLGIARLSFDDKTLSIWISYANGDFSRIPCRNDLSDKILMKLRQYTD